MRQFWGSNRYKIIFVTMICSFILSVSLLVGNTVTGKGMALEYFMLIFLLFSQVWCFIANYWHERHAEDMDEYFGMYNAHRFEKDLRDILADEDSRQNIVLASVDVDSFKTINNLIGYNAGTRMIKDIGHAFAEVLHADEGCYHVRADCFYFIMHRHTLQDVVSFLQHEMDKLSTEWRDSKAISLFFSCGVYDLGTYNDQALFYKTEAAIDTEDRLSFCVDNINFARHHAKRVNRNYLVVYEDKLRGDQAMERRIEDAFLMGIELGEFQLYYQPKYAVINGEKVLKGAEALVRWINAEMGFMSPAQFIPLFNRDGNDVLLDMHVTELACRTIRDWLSDGYEVVPISVNVSRNTTSAENNYLGCVQEMMGINEIPKDLMEFEILESASEQGEEQLVHFINSFHEHGYRIAMDDFGTGYSSLGFLSRTRFDTLKLDKSFFDAWSEDMADDDTAVVRNVLRMAQEMGITTVAEGIEEKYQVERLQEMGCDIIQGYYFSKPLPKDEFEKLLHKKA